MDESNDPNDKGFATGEDNFSGFAIVGEPGPELFDIPPGTTIYPNPIAPLYSLRDHGDCELFMSATMLDGSNYKQVIHFPHEGIRFIPPNPAFGYLEIVRAVAEKDSTYEYAGVYYCPYCDASQVREASSSSDKELSKLFPHDADCIVLKARAMIDAMPHVEVKNERVE